MYGYVIIFDVLDVSIFACRGCFHFLWCKYYNFKVFDVIIFELLDFKIFCLFFTVMLSFLGEEEVIVV
jgi:hypothetical protein